MEKENLTEIARIRKLAGLNESLGEAKAAPSQEEVDMHVAAFAHAFDTLKDAGLIKPEVVDSIDENQLEEGIDTNIKKALKIFKTTALWLGMYGLAGPALDAAGIPHPDLSHVSYDLLQMLSPDDPYYTGSGF